MASKLIQLSDGVLVEVNHIGTAQEVSGRSAKLVRDASLDRLKPIITAAAKPLVDAAATLSGEMDVKEAEIELGVGFEAEGNLFITRSIAEANLTIRIRLAPRTA